MWRGAGTGHGKPGVLSEDRAKAGFGNHRISETVDRVPVGVWYNVGSYPDVS